MSIRPAIALGMEAEVFRSGQGHDAALAQIGFRERARNRLRHGEQPPRRFRRSRRRQSLPAPLIGLRPRKRQKPPGFIDDVVETDKAAALADDVKQIAMVARRRIGPSARPRPCQNPVLSAERTSSVPACCAHRRRANIGLRGGHWRDSGGTPLAPRAQDGRPIHLPAPLFRPPPVRRCARADSAPALCPRLPGRPRRSARTSAASRK